MPRYPIDRSTNFIVEEESWTVVEYDHTSVPGIIYLSLTEGKINSIYDDVNNNLADTDKIAKYDLSIPNNEQIFNIGDPIIPVFTLTKNGVPYDAEIEYITTDKKIAKFVDGTLTAVGAGTVDIIIQLKDYPDIQKTLSVTISDTDQSFSAYIEGSDKIRLDRQNSYKLIGTSELNSVVEFTISNTLATIIKTTNDGCTLQANNKNELGNFVLTALYNGQEYTKTISVIPLW